MAKMSLIIPKIEEQKQIGSFFEQLDTLITLHQKKKEQQIALKQYLLRTLIGEKSIFYSSNLPHTKVKLGDISDIKTGSSDQKDAVENGEFPFFVRSKNIEKSNRWLYDGEAILIPGEGKLGDIYHYINGKFDYHQRVYKISDFKNNSVGKYIYYALQKDFKRHALKYTVKATVDSLRLPTIQNFELVLPNIEIQNVVANQLTLVDNNISSIDNLISDLKSLKKYLLNKLFI